MTIRKQLLRHSYTPEYDRDLDEAIAVDTIFELCSKPKDKLILGSKMLEETETEAQHALEISLPNYRQRWHRLRQHFQKLERGNIPADTPFPRPRGNWKPELKFKSRKSNV